MTYSALPRFVLRSPALPFDVLVRWSQLPDAAARRAMLRELVAEPAVREALFVASPELDGQIAAWQREPESNAQVERALVRYVSRMASRSTPFGLFASVAVGSSGPTTSLELPPLAGAWRHTRLDNDLLFRLCADLARDPLVRARLRYRPSSSLYVAAGRLRYAEARLAGGTRAYHLTAVDRTSYLDALLARAAGGATRDDLIDVLCDPEITRDEAAAFVDEVIDAQLVLPELAPTVTGQEPTDAIIETLAAAGVAERAAPLVAARDRLRAIDAAPPGSPTDAYRAVHALLADGIATKVDASRLFQVDMFKPAPAATLGPEVTAELLRGAQLLHALTPPHVGEDLWTQFRDRFVARYESREVPLLEVLDEESGIGFGDKPSSRAAPLLEDLAFPTRLVPQKTQLGTRDVYLMSLVATALRTGAQEIALTEEDVAKLSDPKLQPLPDVISVTATLIATSSAAIASGDYQVRLAGVGRGASFLGRFCHGSPEVTELTRDALRAEEAFHPDAIFAEIVHLPEGRIGNLILRPVLRDHEIAYLGTSGAPRDKQIELADLLVSVAGDRVVLRSRRLGREVMPRMTTAHNFARGLAPYRFLCAHAEQNTARGFWGWGVLQEMPFLPRIRHGRFIFDRARWILLPRDLAPVGKGGRTAIAELRARLGLPRWVVLSDADNELPVDLDNELMVDSLAHLLKGRKTATLYELLPAPDELCVATPEGRFAHELIVLATRERETRASAPVIAVDPATERRFLPGSSWLYLKLYTGTATADSLLRDYLAPAVRDARGLFDRWFFLRYGDPELHVRVRFAGEPEVLAGKLLPYLHRVLAPAVERGLVWKIALDTYEREVERYGHSRGPANQSGKMMNLAEQVFCADSDCVLAILETCEGNAAADATWRLALRGIDRMMDDLGLSLEDKLRTMTVARDGFGAEVGMDTAFQRRLGDKFRTHRAELAALLAAPDDAPEHPYGPAFATIAARSARLRMLGDELRARGAPIGELVHSFVHMHVNRMIRSAQRAHELVLYDLLRRHYDGALARTRKRTA